MAEPEQTDQVEQHENSDAKLPWLTPAIIRSSARQSKKAGGDYDNNEESPGFLS